MKQDQHDEVSNLSNRRLWEILRQAEQFSTGVDPLLAQRVHGELVTRKEHCPSRRWHAPH